MPTTTGSLSYVNARGYWWSARAYATNYESFVLRIIADVVAPSGAPSRYNGFPLRCLSTVLGHVAIGRTEYNNIDNLHILCYTSR